MLDLIVSVPDHCLSFYFGLTMKSRQTGNDQEPIQSSSTSRPKHKTGEGQVQPRRHLKLDQ